MTVPVVSGALTITVPDEATTTPAEALPGTSVVAILTGVTVQDARADSIGVWDVQASSSDFVSDTTEPGNPTITVDNVSYTTGSVYNTVPANATPFFTVTDLELTHGWLTVATASALTGGIYVATWDPTITIKIPLGTAEADDDHPFTGTIYHSVV